MQFTRREWLLGLGSAAATGTTAFALHSYLFPTQQAGLYINLQGPEGYRGSGPTDKNIPFRLVVWDIKQNKVTHTPVPFHVHSVTYDPRTKTLLGMQKWRQRMFSLDLSRQTIKQVLTHPHTRQCIGHGVLHPDLRAIYVSEALFPKRYDKMAEGKIALRDTQTLRLIQEFPSHGENPHDMRLLQQNQVIAVCNQGTVKRYKPTRSNIAFIRRKDGQLIKKIECPHPAHNFAHMDTLSETEIIAVTKNRTHSKNNFIVRASIDGTLDVFGNGKAKNTTSEEILSVAVDTKRRIVGATNPKGQQVLFWDINTKSLLHTVRGFSKPLGISLTHDNRYYVISDIQKGTALIDASTLQPCTEKLPRHIRQSHFTLAHSTLIEHA